MGRKTSFNLSKRQRSKRKRRDYHPFPINNMSDYRFEKGDKDGGYDNFIPYKDKNYAVDKSEIATKSDYPDLIPKQGKSKWPYSRR